MIDRFNDGLNKKVTVSIPGSCGELVQGVIDGVNFHITLPVNKFCKATASFVCEESPLKPKTRTAVRLLEQFLKEKKGIDVKLDFDYFISLQSDIPSAKGMASSTADIMAAIFSVSELFDVAVSPKEAAGIALKVEPTDGTFINGIAAFDHIEGKIMETISPAPLMDVLVVSNEETLETDFFKRPKYSNEQLNLFKQAYAYAIEGLVSNDLEMVGRAANISLATNQQYYPKPEYELLTNIAPSLGVLGIAVAHSGTVLGLLCEKGDSSRIKEELLNLKNLGNRFDVELLTVIDGGRRAFREDVDFEQRRQTVGA
jgi:L-threonine kinase